MPAKAEVSCPECAEKDLRIQELEDEIEDCHRDRDDVEELIALRDKELAMPGSVLECE